MRLNIKIGLGIFGVVLLLFVAGTITVSQLPEDYFVHKMSIPQMDFEDVDTFEAAVAKLQNAETEFLESDITWSTGEGNVKMNMSDFGLTTNREDVEAELLHFMEEANFIEKLGVFLFGKELDYQLVADENVLKVAFDQAEEGSKLKIQTPVQNAYYTYENQIIDIQPEADGYEVTGTKLKTAVEGFFKTMTVPTQAEISLEVVKPEVTADYLEEMKPKAEDVITRTLVLLGPVAAEWQIVMAEHMEWVVPTADGTFEVQERPFLEFIETEIKPYVEEDAADVTITEVTDDYGNTTYAFEGSGRKEKRIDEANLILAFEEALNGPAPEEGEELLVYIPFNTKQPNVTVPDSLKELGVTEVIGYGYSHYYHSSANRIYNVTYGMELMNGVLIGPGEVFDYWEHIGPVDGEHGWLTELVIKGIEFVPEYGGGLCQTSTTAFRGALFAGFPIVQRTNHANVISYYETPWGQGLDATVYMWEPNFQFLNDTEAHILIQSYVEPDTMTAYFVIYGTDPDRDVYLRGPYTYGYSYGGVQEMVDSSLAPGTKELYQYGIEGMSVDWYRTVINPDGEYHSYTMDSEGASETVILNYENWHSTYSAKPTIYKIGPEAPAEEAKPDGEETPAEPSAEAE